MAENKLRQLLSQLADGGNWKWFDGKTKLPFNTDKDFFENWRHGLSSKAMHEVVDKLNRENGLVVLIRTNQHDSNCRCPGCGMHSEVLQDFGVFWEDQNQLRFTLVQISWVSEMGGFDPSFGIKYNFDQQPTLTNLLEGNEPLIFTLGSYFGYSLILNSL